MAKGSQAGKTKQAVQRDSTTVRVYLNDADRIAKEAQRADRNSKLQIKRILDTFDLVMEATGGVDDPNTVREALSAYKSKPKT